MAHHPESHKRQDVDHHDPAASEQWPFALRRIAGTAEREFWHRLRQMFPEHHVLIKVPIVRFLMPRNPQEVRAWVHVLSGVYCTFTVCTDDGQVIGCVDLIGPAGLPRGNRQIKRTLLTQCNVSYWTVKQGQQIDPHSLRSDFLGLQRSDHESESGALHQPKSHLVAQVRNRLHQTLERNRTVRGSIYSGLENPPSDFADVNDLSLPQTIQVRNRLHETLERNRSARGRVYSGLENPPSDFAESDMFLPETRSTPVAPPQPQIRSAPIAPSQPQTRSAPIAPPQPQARSAPIAPSQPQTRSAPVAPSQPQTRVAPIAPSQPETRSAPILPSQRARARLAANSAKAVN